MIKQPARWNTNMENWVDLIIWGKDYKWFVDKKHGDLDKNGQRESFQNPDTRYSISTLT